jgi:ribosomal protein S18 acetylase RimI-like enzyme
MPTTKVTSGVSVRAAEAGDVDVLSRIWHEGWRDAHLGHVPLALHRHRHLADLRRRLPVRLPTTSVAVVDAVVVGFVTVHDDEVEQLYVHAAFRGTGVAAHLLAHGEAVVGQRFDVAWLAVAAGNTRARRFYERSGWTDAGAFDNPAWTTTGGTIPVPTRRYEKQLRPPR